MINENNTINTNEEIKAEPEVLLYKHQNVAEATRAIAKYIIDRIVANTDDIKKFDERIKLSDRASLTLQRLSSILTNIIPLEQDLMGKKEEIISREKKRSKVTKADCEIVLSMVKSWGLLKENSEDRIDEIVQRYMDEEVENEDN